MTMKKANNVYVENLARTARKLLIENGIPLQSTQYYDKSTLKKIVEFFGGELEVDDDGEKPNSTDFIEKTNIDNSFFIHLNIRGSSPLFFRALHELGHAFLDLPNMSVGEKCYYDGHKASDIQAELFVRAFIMPSDEFELVVKDCIEDGKFNVQKIATHYEIDYVDVLIRGKELNYWE